jgi:hypothetical protein
LIALADVCSTDAPITPCVGPQVFCPLGTPGLADGHRQLLAGPVR